VYDIAIRTVMNIVLIISSTKLLPAEAPTRFIGAPR
jgi:hypothetical protein